MRRPNLFVYIAGKLIAGIISVVIIILVSEILEWARRFMSVRGTTI
ncbi:MAG: hypothetical protein GX362_05165 [Methanosarcinaceae archaeon]|nr:hypothetical protein [Methanosarcinaceae archaeon]